MMFLPELLVLFFKDTISFAAVFSMAFNRSSVRELTHLVATPTLDSSSMLVLLDG